MSRPRCQVRIRHTSCRYWFFPENAIDFWQNRLKEAGVGFAGPAKRFDSEEGVMTLYDPDGLQLELVANKSAEDRICNIWKAGPVPIERALRDFYSVTLSEEGYERTASVLTEQLGFHPTRQEGSRFRYEITDDKATNKIGNTLQFGQHLMGIELRRKRAFLSE